MASISPAAVRREAPAPELRAPGEPARRRDDEVESQQDADPATRSRTLPPVPSRAARDAEAARAASAPPVPGAPDDEWPAPRRLADPNDWADDALTVQKTIRQDGAASAAASAPAQAIEDIPEIEPDFTYEAEVEPPPTRTQARPASAYRASVDPVPEVPEAGILPAIRYLLSFTRARWQRRGAIKTLREQIATDTAALDEILGTLGQQVRALHINNRALSAENEAIDEAERRRARAEHECAELSNRQAEENAKFADVEIDRQTKVSEAEGSLERGQQELGSLEAQRRGLRDKRKEVDSRRRRYIKAAEDREAQAAKQQMGDARGALRAEAENMRREAAGLDPERQDIERRIQALERPIAQASAKVESLKAELESCRRSLNDAREGHRHRLAELEAEQGRKSRELAQSEAEIRRRMVTLGTLVNLNRIERPEFDDLYARIDTLRGGIGARSTEIDRLTAERDAYDKSSLYRGALGVGIAVLLFIVLIVVLLWAI